MADRDPSILRSHRWFGPDDMRSFGHRSRLKGMGFDDDDFAGRPIIGILNTRSDLNTCHSHFRERIEDVRRGVLQSGGFPVEVPVMSLGEMMMKPTTMLYRNLLAMEVEETLRCHPIDAAVLMGGCDKTVPAMLMGAISADVPSIFLPAGPMVRGRYRDVTLGSGSDAWKYWDLRLAGHLCDRDWCGVENGIARSAGTCMTMGTASTMAAATEAMGMTITGAASIPAVHAEHARMAVATARRAVAMAWENQTPATLLSPQAIDDAVTTTLAIGGSTNAIVHLIAIAGRLGFQLTLDRFDELSRETPVIADLRPVGQYLMEDLHECGGVPAVLNEIADRLHLDRPTVTGRTMRENLSTAERLGETVIRPRDRPLHPSGGTCVLRGNLAPAGCVIKSLAADPALLTHRGPAVVFDDYPSLKRSIHDDALDVSADSVLMLRGAGPLGAPGFPEWGMLPIPKKLLRAGVKDMVRISDARMSGTSYGTCVLHVAPESAAGGPLALVQTGDMISIDVPARTIHWEVDEDEIVRRRNAWQPPDVVPPRGYRRMYAHHVLGADRGCDFDFLVGRSPGDEPAIH